MDMSVPTLEHVADWSLANGVKYMKDVPKDKTSFYEDLLPEFKHGFGKNVVMRVGIFHVSGGRRNRPDVWCNNLQSSRFSRPQFALKLTPV